MNCEFEMAKITTAQLKEAANLLLSHLERNEIKEVDITDDFYWDVPAAIRYDQHDEPKELTLGQLSDDASEVKRMLEGDAPPVAYGLVWLAALLRRVGETSVC